MCKKVYEMFLSTIVPFFDYFNTINKIYEEYAVENPTNANLNLLEIGKWDSKELHFSNLMFLNLLCAKYNKQKPLILSQYFKHRQGTNVETLKLIDKIENYKFG